MDVILIAKLKKIIFAIFGKQMVIAGVMSAEMELLMLKKGKNVMMGIEMILMDVVQIVKLKMALNVKMNQVYVEIVVMEFFKL